MMQVNFTDASIESIKEIIEFLRRKWSEEQIEFFLQEIDEFVENQIQGSVYKHPFYKKTQIRKVLIAKKQVSLFYVEKDLQTIDILLLWSNKKDPILLSKMLKSK